ncbi:hypothetical protein M513_09826 [Trichuris suis]|uniref:Peptidase A2 domain-containing protein n=1 Tax=Trichuris suis TaxID=68888 RepID=A0A085LWC8_9BILA|nr:hypothetical protein M513_09826 [Trichuris suis]
MIRDQLIKGTSSPCIRERLLSLSELTLETALTVARQMESAKKDAVIISTPEANVSVQMTKRYSSQNARRSNDRSVSSQRCYRCGSNLHLANYLKCPAKHAQCRKMGHFAQVCRSVNSQKQSKTVHSLLSTRASDADRPYVHVSISSGSDSCAPRCMLDTGSPVSILPADIFRRYFPSVQLCKSTVSLVTYTKSALPTLGCFPAIVRYKGRTASTNFFVGPSGTPLLGTDLIGALKIAIRGMRVVSTLSTTFGPCRAISSIKNFVHEVKERSDVKPVQQKMRRPSLSVRNAEEDSNHEMLVQISKELPAVKYDDIAKATEHCMLLQKVIDCVQNGWPKNMKDIEERLIPFFRIKYELAVQDGCLIRGRHRIVIPQSLQGSLVSLAHESHQGIARTKSRL